MVSVSSSILTTRDTHKATGQGVEQEPQQKLLGGNSHQPLLALVRVVLPAESDLAVGKVHDPVVGDCDAMRVAGQVMQDMFGSAERSFGVDHPVLTEQGPQYGRLSARRAVSGFQGKAVARRATSF